MIHCLEVNGNSRSSSRTGKKYCSISKSTYRRARSTPFSTQHKPQRIANEMWRIYSRYRHQP